MPERFPHHITLRFAGGLPSLRDGDAVKQIWNAMDRAHRDDFRIVEFGVEPDHMHLVAEAANKTALGTGMQRFKTRMTRNLNKLFGRTGTIFAERYHARALKTPREVHHALRYVLLNWRHHLAERGESLPPDWVDPYSSAMWFDGWSHELPVDEPWKNMLRWLSPPTRPATTWLLRVGWRRHGLLRLDEVPGPTHRRRRAA
ncbi:MAG TPA: transposase [Kofleriaceae bacterium]|nr:transposase [Kofleriaceae bacterium]